MTSPRQRSRPAALGAARGRRTTSRSTTRSRGAQRGSASVLALGVSLALLSLLIGALALGSAVIASQRARAAADASALAGAARLLQGAPQETSCAAAARVADANGAGLTGCRTTPADVTVTVEVPASVRGLGTARAVARAGASTR